MAQLGLVVFSIEEAHWDAIEEDHAEDQLGFRLFDGAHGMSGKLLRLLERPRVEGEVEEEWWIN